MFHGLPPYVEVRENSVGWLPKLPAHWGLERGKSLFKRVQREPSDTDGVVTCFRDGVVTLRSRRRSNGFTESLKEIGYQGIRRGDLVIHAMDAFAGAVGVSDSDGKGTPVYSVCVPRIDANPHYFAAVVREMARTSWILALSKGVRERSTDFRYEIFATQLFPVPPAPEQAAIVKYLAHANARIDKAISAKRRLIALLEEQRDATVRAILSTPSDPKAPSKLVATGRLCRIETGVEDSGNADPDGDYPFFVRGREILRASDFDFDTEAVLTPGDGQGGTGKVFHYYNGKFQAHQRVYVFSQFSGILARYFYWCMTAFFREHALAQSNTVTMESLRRPVLASFRVAVPDEDAQRALVERIEAQVTDTAQVVEKTQREIALLREFRTRLVADVVTGQVDVRAIAASLPDTPEQHTDLGSLLDDDLEDARGEGEE